MRRDGGQPVTLGNLVERAWTVPLNVVRTPAGLDVPLSYPAFCDPLARPSVREGTVLLAVGIDVDDPAAVELVLIAGEGRAAAVAFRTQQRVTQQLLDASDASGVALLGVPPEVTWEDLYVMMHTAVVTTDAPMAEAEGDDLFALANAVAAMVGGPVVIDDPYLRVLAYSVLDQSLDTLRRDSILGRSLPEGWRQRLRDLGVFDQLWTPDTIVRLDGDPEAGLAPRMAIAVRAGSSILGAIWVAQGDGPFDEAAETAGLAFVAFSMTTDPFHWGMAMYRWHLPYKVAFMLSFALRFFPLFQEEFLTVNQALESRGFGALISKNPVKRVTGTGVAITPVALSALRRSREIALAMEVRGFSYPEAAGVERTLYRRIELRAVDYALLALAPLTTVALLAMRA